MPTGYKPEEHACLDKNRPCLLLSQRRRQTIVDRLAFTKLFYLTLTNQLSLGQAKVCAGQIR